MTDHHKFQFIMKKAFNLVSTFKNTPWYNETNSSSKKNINIEDINIQESPSVPIWEKDISDNYTDLSFGSGDISGIHTISSGNYNSNEYMSSGVHLDSTGTVALFVRLKLDKMDDYDICDNAYAYTVYPTTESNNLLLENAYKFNYNSQINVNATIPIFKPYNYTLEYSSDGTTFNRLANSDGNWIFDNKTGIITFEENPTVDLGSTDLYFTFVKYLGVQGLQNLLYYKNGKVGINVSDPQSELDVSGSVSITGDLTVEKNLNVDTSTLYIDSTNKQVGINTTSPTSNFTLDVSGSALIEADLSINYGIGPGFYPIGSIIMWPTSSTPNIDYGIWLLCDGATITSNYYPELETILGGTTLPNFKDNYVKMTDSDLNDTFIVGTGNNTIDFDISEDNIPSHSHNSSHGHNVSNQSHTHEIAAHNHSVTVTDHSHEISKHTHDVGSTPTHHHEVKGHSHECTESAHYHGNNATNGKHGHTWSLANHTHTYQYMDFTGYFDKSKGTMERGSGSDRITHVNATQYSQSESNDYTNTTSMGGTDVGFKTTTIGNSAVSSLIINGATGNNNTHILDVDTNHDKNLSITVSTEALESDGTTHNTGSSFLNGDDTKNWGVTIGNSTHTDISGSNTNDFFSQASSGDIQSYTAPTTNVSIDGNAQDSISIDIGSNLKNSTAYFFIRAA